jgi:hypothetical protein
MVNSQNVIADYRCYFLFRTYRWQAGQQIREPAYLSHNGGNNSPIHYQVSKDKRLFPGPLFNQDPLTTLSGHLLKQWQIFRNLYGQDADTLLLGVVLLIIHDSANPSSLTLTMPAHHSNGKVESIPLMPTGNRLFTIREANAPSSQWLGCQEWLPAALNLNEWQLHFTPNQAMLMPMQTEEFDNHPIFAVYSLDRSELPELSTFLYGDADSTVMNQLVPMLVTRHWQFSHINYATTQFRDSLQAQNTRYRGIQDEELKCHSTAKLEETIQEMSSLYAEAMYILGRLPQAINTLEINEGNLKRRMQGVEDHTQSRWVIDWQPPKPSTEKEMEDDQHPPSKTSSPPPLLAAFQRDIKTLKNNQVYIQGKLTYLEGSRLRWQAFLEERKIELTEWLGALGHIIILAVALAEGLKLLEEYGLLKHEGWLSASIVTVIVWGFILILLILFAIPPVLILLKMIRRGLSCGFKTLRHILGRKP